jgi:hypothetical protein
MFVWKYQKHFQYLTSPFDVCNCKKVLKLYVILLFFCVESWAMEVKGNLCLWTSKAIHSCNLVWHQTTIQCTWMQAKLFQHMQIIYGTRKSNIEFLKIVFVLSTSPKWWYYKSQVVIKVVLWVWTKCLETKKNAINYTHYAWHATPSFEIKHHHWHIFTQRLDDWFFGNINSCKHFLKHKTHGWMPNGK